MIAKTKFGIGRLGYFVVIVVALAAADTDTADSPPADSTAHADQQQPISERHKATSEDELHLKTLDAELFKQIFVEKRKTYLEFIKILEKMDNYERQYDVINGLAKLMFSFIESHKVLLEDFTESDPKNISFVAKSNSTMNITYALSHVLENVALFSDLLLYLPDITKRVLRKQPEWNWTMRWSFKFLNRTRDQLDKPTLAMIEQVLQELNVTKREAGYSNPNSIPRVTNQPKNAKKEQNKKEKRKKGPTITKVEL